MAGLSVRFVPDSVTPTGFMSTLHWLLASMVLFLVAALAEVSLPCRLVFAVARAQPSILAAL